MRLLNARTYELQTFLGKDKPNYAILSHTWEDGEVLFEDIRNTSKIDWTAKKGYFKIKKTCDQALEDGCDFVWIDTCNINKDSSSELSEAINSMFRWYKDATICYAYISDIKIGDEWSFSKCRWLTRGWTLQEMIAPDRVHFYDADWSFLGSRISLANELSGISGIQKSVLLRRNYTRRLVSLSTEENMDRRARMNNCSCCKDQEEVEARSMLETFSVAQKMKWASERTTTREEDVAYCLMGLFDVNMPLLYGEGTRAFFRLQKAILEMRSDHSILAFRSNLPNSNGEDCPRFLAPNPTAFCDDIQSIYTPAHVKGASLHGTTLSIDMLLCPVQGGNVFPKRYLAILDCSMADDPHARPAILLLAIDHEDRKTFRCTSYTNNLYLLHSSHPGEARAMVVDTSSERDLSVLLYKPRDIERVHVSIVGEDLAMRFIRHYSATRYVQVNISSVFRDLGYQYASSLPLTEEHMVFSTSQPGLIDILHERAGNLSVYWNQDAYGLLSCKISSYSSPPNVHTIQQQTGLHCKKDSSFPNNSVTTSHIELGKSKSIVLEGPGTTTLEVWISISNETFIGSSRLVLAVHGKIKKPESDRKGKAGLILGLLGT